MSRRARWLLVIVAAAVAFLVALFVLLQSSDPTVTASTPTPVTTTGPETVGFEIVVFDGKPVDGIQRISVAKGDTVQIEVSRIPGDEIHLHGYDKTLELGADGTGTLTFEATLQGVFEVELERAGIQVAELTVR